jgi:hypothetical protein
MFTAGTGITCETTADGTVTITNTISGASTATSSATGLIKIEDDTDQSVAAESVSTTANRTYGLQLNSSDQGVVNVPWTDTNTTYSAGDFKLDDLDTPDDNTDLDFTTSAHGLVPKGTNTGNFLKDDGTWAAAAGGLKSQQVFTSSGTWTKPSGITLVKVYVTGGGGGGSDAGGGGAGGGTAIKIIDVSAISSETVTIGSGGGDGDTGSTGGTTSFGSHCSATGGGGGTSEAGVTGYPGAGGIGSSGDINLRGQAGSTKKTTRGGASYWGDGGHGNRTDGTYCHAGNGDSYGGGGGGHSDTSQPGHCGSGGDGIVVVEEYK